MEGFPKQSNLMEKYDWGTLEKIDMGCKVRLSDPGAMITLAIKICEAIDRSCVGMHLEDRLKGGEMIRPGGYAGVRLEEPNQIWVLDINRSGNDMKRFVIDAVSNLNE
jgi:hypothetical protein